MDTRTLQLQSQWVVPADIFGDAAQRRDRDSQRLGRADAEASHALDGLWVGVLLQQRDDLLQRHSYPPLDLFYASCALLCAAAFISGATSALARGTFHRPAADRP